MPMVRVANTGISGVFDPFGREIGRIDLEHSGILDVDLPQPLADRTLFSRLGNWPTLVLARARGAMNRAVEKSVTMTLPFSVSL